VKPQRAAGPFRLLAIRPSSGRAWVDSLPEKIDRTASALGSCTSTPATPRSPLAQRNRDHRKEEYQHDCHSSQRRTSADPIREAHRRPRQRDHRRRNRHRPPDRDDPESVLRLIWPYTAKLYAGIHLSQRRQAARDDAVFNELIARLDEEDDDCDG
jgi:hypothetical protein